MAEQGQRPQSLSETEVTLPSAPRDTQLATSMTAALPTGSDADEPLAILLQALQSSLATSPSSPDSTIPQYCLPQTVTQSVGSGYLSMITPAALNTLINKEGQTSAPDLNHTASQLLQASLEALAASNQPPKHSHTSAPINGFVGSFPSPGALAGMEGLAQLHGLPRQGSVPQCQVPSLSSLLTPADTTLLASLLALRQRQYAEQLSNGNLLMSSLRPGHGRVHSNTAPSSLYKTELCRSWQETGSCRYGNKCQFAHGPHELRPIQRHPKYKTEICRTFAQTGTCPYGTRCRFIHYFHRTAASASPMLSQPMYSPTSLMNLPSSGSSSSSLESYLTSYSGAALARNGSGLDAYQQPPVGQVSPDGTFMPPLPPPAEQNLSLLSRLPSLTPLASGSSPSEAQRRLPVFRTFTDSPKSNVSTHTSVGNN